MLVNTASMSRNGFLKPIKPSAKPDGPKQPPPNLPNEASSSSLWKQAGIAQKLNYFSRHILCMKLRVTKATQDLLASWWQLSDSS